MNRPVPQGHLADSVVIELGAVIVAVSADHPRVLVVRRPGADGEAPEASLPAGRFDPSAHRTLEEGLRASVAEATAQKVGYVEQLYTFGDRGRYPAERGGGRRVVSVGYLALTGPPKASPDPDSAWDDWYRYFPWEDWRRGRPEILDASVLPGVEAWADSAADPRDRELRRDRIAVCFGADGAVPDEEKVLERYELLYEAGLVAEAARDRQREDGVAPPCQPSPPLGEAMRFDHRRILATAMGRLRGKLKYRPVVFELMPPAFTLLSLQRTVEAVAGLHLHKQNFRRLVEQGGLVERTGKLVAQGAGRPAEQFRFRSEVFRERPAPGVRLPSRRAKG
jgi:hypothetical protein